MSSRVIVWLVNRRSIGSRLASRSARGSFGRLAIGRVVGRSLIWSAAVGNGDQLVGLAVGGQSTVNLSSGRSVIRSVNGLLVGLRAIGRARLAGFVTVGRPTIGWSVSRQLFCWSFDRLFRLPGERPRDRFPRDRFPLAPKRFMTYSMAPYEGGYCV